MRSRPKNRSSREVQDHPSAIGRVAVLSDDVARLREVLDLLAIGVVVVDADGGQVFANRQGSTLGGDTPGDVVIAAAVSELLRSALVGGAQTRSIELRSQPPRSVDVSAIPLRSGGAVAIVEDASERRQLDTIRRDFVANVSHELRTPVGALGLLAEALAGEQDEAVVQRLARRISIEADRAKNLIQDLLDLSRIEANQSPVEQPVDLGGVLSAAAEAVLALGEQRGVEVRIGLPDRVACAMGDRDQLVSAVSNLLDNAIKYSEPKTVVDVGLRHADGWCEVIIRDEGVGIPAKDVDRIFERFYRVDRARDRRTGGSGLGLAIVRHIASNHGGEVSVRSREGEGSTFTLRIPEAR